MVIRFQCGVSGEEPIQATAGSVGYDLKLAKGVKLKKGESRWLLTATRLALPGDVGALVAPRSSALMRYGVIVILGVLDPDYRGVIKVGVVALRDTQIPKGAAVAQLVFVPRSVVRFIQADFGEGTHKGFGSTDGEVADGS